MGPSATGNLKSGTLPKWGRLKHGKKALLEESELTLLVRPDLGNKLIYGKVSMEGTEGPPLAPMPTPCQSFLFQPLQEGNLDAQGNQCDTANVTLRTLPWSG